MSKYTVRRAALFLSTALAAGVVGISPAATLDFINGFSAALAQLSGGNVSRAGNATLFDSTGKLTYAPNNLLTYSNTFSNAAWSKANAGTGVLPVVTANVGTDPLGGNNSSRLQIDRGASNTSSDYSLFSQSATLPTRSTIGLRAIWVKSNTGSTQTALIYDGGGGRAVGKTVAVTTTWQQVSLVDIGGSGTNANIQIGSRGGSGQYYTGGDQTLDILIYAATVSAVTYETTPRAGDQVITTSSAYYGARQDYDPATSTAKGLLIEEARTNLDLQSEDLTAASWVKYQGALSTDGTLDSAGALIQKFTPNGGGASPQIYSAALRSINSGANYTLTREVMAGGTNFVWVSIGLYAPGHFVSAVFDISGSSDTTATQTAVGATSGTLVSATAKYLGGGRFRICLVGSLAQTSALTGVGPAEAATGISFDAYGERTGGGLAASKTFYSAHYGFEAGSFATSHIPTGASSVTRAAEAAQLSGAGLTTLNGTTASVVIETQGISSTGGNNGRFIEGTNPNLYWNSSGTTNIRLRNAAPVIIDTVNTATRNSVNRAAAAFDAAGRSVVLNGGAVVSDANAANFAGSLYFGGSDDVWLRSIAIYSSKLPDATLQAKSVPGASY